MCYVLGITSVAPHNFHFTHSLGGHSGTFTMNEGLLNLWNLLFLGIEYKRLRRYPSQSMMQAGRHLTLKLKLSKQKHLSTTPKWMHGQVNDFSTKFKFKGAWKMGFTLTSERRKTRSRAVASPLQCNQRSETEQQGTHDDRIGEVFDQPDGALLAQSYLRLDYMLLVPLT